MSTRSTVGMKTEDGKFLAIYVHYDGYPEHMLENLPENKEDALDMIMNGDGSSIDQGEVIKTVSNYKNSPSVYETQYSWLSNMKESWCEYYYLWDEDTNSWKYGNL